MSQKRVAAEPSLNHSAKALRVVHRLDKFSHAKRTYEKSLTFLASWTWSATLAQEGVFAPNYEVEEIAEIAQRLRKKAGLPDEPTGTVANEKE